MNRTLRFIVLVCVYYHRPSLSTKFNVAKPPPGCSFTISMTPEQYEDICPVRELANLRKQIGDVKYRVGNVTREHKRLRQAALHAEREQWVAMQTEMQDTSWKLDRLQERVGELELTVNNLTTSFAAHQEDISRRSSVSLSRHFSARLYTKLERRINQLATKLRRLDGIPIPTSCAGIWQDGIFTIQPRQTSEPFDVVCSQSWTLLSRRFDGSVNFYRDWKAYSNGFGNQSSEFWLGNGNIYKLVNQGSYRLMIDMVDWNDTSFYAQYDRFYIDSEEELFRLHVANYSGNLSNAMYTDEPSHFNHNGQAFSTYDHDNDGSPSANCAKIFAAGNWFNDCYVANLNGPYCTADENHSKCMVWWSPNGRVVLKSVTLRVKEIGGDE